MPQNETIDLGSHALTSWTGPLGLPDFTRIGDGDFAPVFDAALAAHQAEIDSIADNADKPTIDNTLKALELAGDPLDRVSSIFWCRAGAHTIAQDEATSVVWGMPGAAVANGAAQDVVALEQVAQRLLALSRGS